MLPRLTRLGFLRRESYGLGYNRWPVGSTLSLSKRRCHYQLFGLLFRFGEHPDDVVRALVRVEQLHYLRGSEKRLVLEPSLREQLVFLQAQGQKFSVDGLKLALTVT